MGPPVYGDRPFRTDRILIAEEDHFALEQGAVDRIEVVVRERPRKIDAVNLGANRRRHRDYFEMLTVHRMDPLPAAMFRDQNDTTNPSLRKRCLRGPLRRVSLGNAPDAP